jgi:hypothetical protein
LERQVSVSELRRRPMRIVREAQGSAEGGTITFRGFPVAVLRGWSGPCEQALELGTGPASSDTGIETGEAGEALNAGAGWLAGNTDPEVADAEAVLDSASWGLWESLPDAQRQALVRAIHELRVGAERAVSCDPVAGEASERGNERTT